MNDIKRGSALLLVMTFAALISMIGISWWIQSGLDLDIARERVRFYQRFYYTEIALQEGIMFARSNFSLLNTEQVQKELPLIFPLSQLPQIDLNLQRSLQGMQLVFMVDKLAQKPNDDVLFIKALLSKNHKVICSLRCLMRRIEHEGKEAYVLDGFTLGTLSQ
ncbi:MAG: hypothetical protein H6679_04790 [Epsilonproteobacteria bacterium]|nr:hypothetical protein [Campylobacterota bacterium]